jgi:hypothetical protein
MTDDKPLKDSGKRREFGTGAVRDVQDNKPRPELMNPMVDTALSVHFAKGAAKYEARNWEKGMPESSFVASAKRHMNQWLMGETDEDHLIAWLWNVYCLKATEDMIERGILPESLRDLPDYRERKAPKLFPLADENVEQAGTLSPKRYGTFITSQDNVER